MSGREIEAPEIRDIHEARRQIRGDELIPQAPFTFSMMDAIGGGEVEIRCPYPSLKSGRGMLMYSVTFDPRTPRMERIRVLNTLVDLLTLRWGGDA